MSGNFPASSKWIKFLFFHLQTLCPHCSLYHVFQPVGHWSLLFALPLYFTLFLCSSFQFLKIFFLFLLCNPFPSVFNTVTWILSKLGLMSYFSFLIVNHKKVNFVIWIGEDAMWMWLFFPSNFSILSLHFSLDSGSILFQCLHFGQFRHHLIFCRVSP